MPPATGGAGGGPTGGAGGTGGIATGGAPIDVPDASTDSGSTDSGAPRDTLDKTGLYAPGGGEVLASGVRAYEVRYQLWSDGAAKLRYLYLPPGTKIDTTDMDGWVFPVGTKVWKEFKRDGVRVETRLLEKTAETPADAGSSEVKHGGWKRIAYAWNAAQTEALAIPDGTIDALGTGHDIPAAEVCSNCHDGSKDFVLGVSAIQLAHDNAGVTLKTLKDEGRLTAPPASTSLPLPGTAVAQAALGTLHANCSMCHQPGTFAYERTDMDLRLTVGTLATVQGTHAYRTTVNVTTSKAFENATVRILPGDPVHSAVHQRMSSREALVAMPPIATELVDTVGAKAVSDWILSLNP